MIYKSCRKGKNENKRDGNVRSMLDNLVFDSLDLIQKKLLKYPVIFEYTVVLSDYF